MRWLFGRRAQACPVCGAELERGAAWCGACGARADGGDEPEQPVTAEAAADPAQPSATDMTAALGRSGRRVLAAVAVVAFIALAVASQLRQPVPEPLLGHLGASTGMSAAGPPPAGLRLAWAHEPPGPTGVREVGESLEVVARDDRVRVGNLVVDADGGQLVGATEDLWQLSGVERTVVDDRELLVIDTLSGEVRSRAPLPDDLPDHPHWDVRRGQGASLVGLEDGSVLVADDGAVVAEVDGHFLSHVDRAFGDPAAFPVRERVTDGLVIHLDGQGREVQRIAVDTRTVHELVALGDTVVAVVDDRIIGLRTDGTGITRDDEVELP